MISVMTLLRSLSRQSVPVALVLVMIAIEPGFWFLQLLCGHTLSGGWAGVHSSCAMDLETTDLESTGSSDDAELPNCCIESSTPAVPPAIVDASQRVLDASGLALEAQPTVVASLASSPGAAAAIERAGPATTAPLYCLFGALLL